MNECQVYNSDGQYLNSVKLRRGLRLILEDKAIVIEVVNGEKIKTAHTEFAVPSKVVLKRYANAPGKYKKVAPLSAHNIFLRDKFTCSYCGRHDSQLDKTRTKVGKPREYLTKEHIIPKDQGGQHTWTNVTTGCNTCNNKKDNRTPEQAHMPLLRQPYAPTVHEMQQRKGRPQ